MQWLVNFAEPSYLATFEKNINMATFQSFQSKGNYHTIAGWVSLNLDAVTAIVKRDSYFDVYFGSFYFTFGMNEYEFFMEAMKKRHKFFSGGGQPLN